MGSHEAFALASPTIPEKQVQRSLQPCSLGRELFTNISHLGFTPGNLMSFRNKAVPSWSTQSFFKHLAIFLVIMEVCAKGAEQEHSWLAFSNSAKRNPLNVETLSFFSKSIGRRAVNPAKEKALPEGHWHNHTSSFLGDCQANNTQESVPD